MSRVDDSATETTRRGRATTVLPTLFLGAFATGCSELLVVGVLDLIGADLRISAATAGALVTAYAVGLALGGPALTALTVRRNRRGVVLGALAGFVVANLLPVLVTNIGVFFAARLVSGAMQGLFLAGAFGVATAIVPAERVGRAMSVVISGFAVSTALGLPLSNLIGQALGWRGSLTTVVVLAAAVLAASLHLVPPTSADTAATAARQARHALAPRVLAVLGLGGLAFAGVFATVTYVVPFLHEVTGISGVAVTAFLLAYGAADAAGALGGGRYADLDAQRTLVVATAGLSLALLTLYFTGTVAALVAPLLVALGVFGMGMAPSLQYRVVELAGPGAALAASLPASAANVGIAVGSAVGGLALRGGSPSAVVLTGFGFAVAATAVALVTSRLRPPAPEVAEAADSGR